LSVHHAVEGVALEQRGQQLRGVDQRFLGRLAVAWIEVRGDPVQHEGHRRQVDGKDAEEQPGATRHGAAQELPEATPSAALALQTPLDVSFAFLYAEEWNDSTRSSAR